MTEQEMKEYVDSLERELDGYRNIGSVRHLKRLRQQEIRRKKLLERTLWALKNLFFVALLAFDIWVLVSWIDIITHNLCPSPVYQEWNFFVLFF